MILVESATENGRNRCGILRHVWNRSSETHHPSSSRIFFLYDVILQRCTKSRSDVFLARRPGSAIELLHSFSHLDECVVCYIVPSFRFSFLSSFLSLYLTPFYRLCGLRQFEDLKKYVGVLHLEFAYGSRIVRTAKSASGRASIHPSIHPIKNFDSILV